MASWPATLPNPTWDYALNPVDQTVSTNMEVGASRVRRRTSARNDKADVKWQMSDAQYVIFRAWFDDGTTGAAGGASWFAVNLPVGAGGLTSITAKFDGPFKAMYQSSTHWIVTAKLELR